jgi:hypothetical protein
MKFSKIFVWICLILWIVTIVLNVVECAGGATASWPITIIDQVLILFFVARDLALEYFFYPYMTFTRPVKQVKQKEDNE